jgi:hypothetical protein
VFIVIARAPVEVLGLKDSSFVLALACLLDESSRANSADVKVFILQARLVYLVLAIDSYETWLAR